MEPALLSLFCRELNEERKRRGQPQFDEQLVEDAKRDILSNYYSSCVRDLPPRVADFIESELITEKGFRNSYAREDAVPSRLTEDELARLIGSRLLRLEDHYGAQRIELTHDVLTGVVREHRDRRRAEDEKAALAARAEQERQALEQAAAQREAELDRERRVERQRRLESEARAARRFRWLSAVLAIVSVAALILAAVAGSMQYDSFRHTEGLRLVSEAEQMLNGGRPGGDVRALQQLLAAESLGASTAEAVTNSRRDVVKILENPPRAGQQGVTPVRSVAVSLDGRRIAWGSDDHTVRVWDTNTGSDVHALDVGGEGKVWSVAFRPGGLFIATGSDDGTLQVWDATSGAKVGKTMRHTGAVYSVAFSPDGQRIATGSSDAAVRVWDWVSGAEVVRQRSGDDPQILVRSVAFSPGGDRLVSGDDSGTVRLWNARTGQQKAEFAADKTVMSVAFSPEDVHGADRIAVGRIDGAIQLLDGQTLAPLGGSFDAHPNSVNSVAFSPGGTRIVSGGSDNTVRVWDSTTHAPIGGPLTGHHGEVSSVAFNGDATRIVSGGLDGSVRVWDAVAGLPIPAGQGDRVAAVAFSPDGQRIASGGTDGTVMLWNPDTAAYRPAGLAHRRRTASFRSPAWPSAAMADSSPGDRTACCACGTSPLSRPHRGLGWPPMLAVNPRVRRSKASPSARMVRGSCRAT